ncbi:hypothetical protein LCGC14_1838550, partial [marine sediment metagenome]
IATPRLAKEVQQVATNLKVQGLPEAIRAAKADFTHVKMKRREVDNILKEHPDLPRPVRDHLMQAYDDNSLFREVPVTETVIRKAPTTASEQKVFMHEEVSEYVKSHPGEDLWFHGGSEIEDVTVEGLTTGFATKDIDEALDFAFGVSGIGQLHIIKGKKGMRLVEKGVTEIEESVIPVLSISVEKEYLLIVQKVVTPGNSIDGTIRESNTIMLDDFIASPERASTQYEQLADMLTQLEVCNPQEVHMPKKRFAKKYSSVRIARETAHSYSLPFPGGG